MIEVLQVLTDPDLSSAWQIIRIREPSQREDGSSCPAIQAYGAVRNLAGRQIEMVPAADRVHGVTNVSLNFPDVRHGCESKYY